MKHLYFLFSLLFILSSGSLLAQSDSSVWYIATWKKGDSQRFKITKKEVEYSNGKLSKNQVETYIASINVVKASKKAYELDYRHEKSLFNNTPELPSEVKAAVKKYDDLSIRYTTDMYGTYTGIQNWKELSKMVQSLMQEYAKTKAPADAETFNQIMKPIIAAYSSKESIESNVFPELSYIHSPYGGIFALYDTVTYDDNFPNIFGGPPVKAVGKVYYAKPNPESSVSEMINEVTLDPGDARLMIIDFMERVTSNVKHANEEEKAKRAAELKEIASGMEVDIKDYNSYTYDEDNAWPVKVTFKRERLVNMGDQKSQGTKEIIIERLE